ncbi:MAG: prepilin-type N-terminal cleavage/methylation domain-containing protein [Nitrospirae bacterium]|nr:prepilin-type N-terminal cleavage/methylation domain-containing protein [Nitrospirota bacterium]
MSSKVQKFKSSKVRKSLAYNLQLITCNSGFTLLEVLVALAISGIALIVVLQLLSSNLKAISASEDYVSAVIKVEAKMREILDNSNLSEGSWSEVTPDGYQIDVSIRDAEKDRTQNLRVRLLGVDLTIHWTKGTKHRSLTLKTLKVVNKKI